MNRVAEVVFEAATRLASRHQIATCSLLQRQLGVSYADARLILAQLGHRRWVPSVHHNHTVAEIGKEWIGKQALASGGVSSVTADFFAVESGIAFSSTDLYCALIGSRGADELSVAYTKVRAVGSDRANALVMTILDRIAEDTHAWPADGLVFKITSDPTRLFGHEVRQICLALRGHTAQHCVTALAIQYDGQGDDLALEAIASRINSP